MKTLTIEQMENIYSGSACADAVISTALGILGMIGAIATLGPGSALLWSAVGFASGNISMCGGIEGMIRNC